MFCQIDALFERIMLMEEYLDNVSVAMPHGSTLVPWPESPIKAIFSSTLTVEEDGPECCRIENPCSNSVSEDEVLLNSVVPTLTQATFLRSEGRGLRTE